MSASHCENPVGVVNRPSGDLVVALAGNPNVGKSTIFNSLTGLGVSTAHYPGTTRGVHVGTSTSGTRRIGVVDLPGTYALEGPAEASQIASRALAELTPDVVVVVVDPATLARNLYLALEVLEAGFRLVVAVNLADEARRSGIQIDVARLERGLGAPVVTTVATQGVGIRDLVDAAFEVTGRPPGSRIRYGADFEALIEPLVRTCRHGCEGCDAIACDTAAIALVEGRASGSRCVDSAVLSEAARVRTAMRGHFGEEPAIRVSRERHDAAARISESAIRRIPQPSRLRSYGLWSLTTRPATGVPLVFLASLGVFGFLFFIGEALAAAFSGLWEAFAAPAIGAVVSAIAGQGLVSRILLWGFDAGIEASLAIGLPYILTFYLLLGFLEDTGYLNSLSFLTDRLMHRFGLHGRAIIPLVAAAGCNVPALIAASQLGTERERRIASTLVLFVPCSARTAVILGSVGHYIGWQPALLVLGIVATVWMTLASFLDRMVPGEAHGLVMEMFGFRRPSLKRVAAKAWEQFREFLFIATPIVIGGSLVLGGLYESGWLLRLSEPLAPVVEGWLGLPAVAGITLLVGMLRKELSLQLLVALAVATGAVAGGLTGMMSATDLVVYALVNAIALPCISSVTVYWRRQGALRTFGVIGMSVTLAIVIGGIVARILPLVGFGA